jgi:DNA polymerase III delta prime subunit
MSTQLHVFHQSQDHSHQLKNLLEIKWQNNPDLLEFNTDQSGLKIDQVRKLIAQLPYKPYSEEKRHFVIYNFEQTTIEAQNALLKSLEEPPENVEFVLTTTNLQNVLPTIQSRSLVHHHATKKEQTSQKDLTELITNLDSYGAAIELASQYKKREEAIELLENLITQLHQLNQTQPTAQTTFQIKILDEHLAYLHQNSNVSLTLEAAFFAIINNKK